MNQPNSIQLVDLGAARRRVKNSGRRYRVRFRHFRNRRRFVAFLVDTWTGAKAAHPTLYVLDPRLGRRAAKNQREAAQAAAELETAWNAGGPGATLEPETWDKAREDLLSQKTSGEAQVNRGCLPAGAHGLRRILGRPLAAAEVLG